MRIVIPAIAAALVLTVGTASLAAKKQSSNTRSYASSNSYNKCVSLARQRGYSSSDIEDSRGAARRFVQNCMRGKTQ